MVTFVIVLLISFHHEMKAYICSNQWIVVVSIIILIMALVTLFCCEGGCRSYPSSLILLGLITLAEGICVGFISLKLDSEMVN